MFVCAIHHSIILSAVHYFVMISTCGRRVPTDYRTYRQPTPAGLTKLHQKGRCCWRNVLASSLRHLQARRLCRRPRNSACVHAHAFGRDTTIRAKDDVIRGARIKWGGGGAGTNACWTSPNLLHAVYLTPARHPSQLGRQQNQPKTKRALHQTKARPCADTEKTK